MALNPTTAIRRGASALATAALLITSPVAVSGPYRSVAYAQPMQGKTLFTAQECAIITRLLVDEMKTYKSRPNDPDSVMTPTLIKSASGFIGLDKDQMVCEGPIITWSTRGDKAVLDAVALEIHDLEQARKIPTKGLMDKYLSVIGKTSQRASLEPLPPQ
jgi:hypothetical protein